LPDEPAVPGRYGVRDGRALPRVRRRDRAVLPEPVARVRLAARVPERDVRAVRPFGRRAVLSERAAVRVPRTVGQSPGVPEHRVPALRAAR
jgi:hypothetical protein